MKYTDISIKLWAAQELKLIKSNTDFYKRFPEKSIFLEFINNNKNIDSMAEKIKTQMEYNYEDGGVICVFDEEFPIINKNVNFDRPYLLFYKGNLALLDNLNNNVAVIGVINPDKEIEYREEKIVKKLVENDIVIVSGLALGCDTVAHKTCVKNGGKTIAILPTSINKITPLSNRSFAKEIVDNDGLLLTEYYKEPSTKWEAVERFIKRDRLQAMFSKAVILIASYSEKQGDSGSRHAMKNALSYGINRYVMYNEEIDKNNPQFGLNRDILRISDDLTKILVSSSIEEIKNLYNINLCKQERACYKQISIFDENE